MMKSNMMSLSRKLVFVIAAAFLLVMIIGAADAFIPCKYVKDHAKACKDYATGDDDGVAVPKDCCKGLKRLVRKAVTVDDKKDVCGCFSKAFAFLPVKDDRLSKITADCKVKVPFVLRKKPDCASIKNY